MSQTDESAVGPILGPEDGDIMGDPETVLDRFMIGGEETAGRFALVEHRLAPFALAAPLHRHTNDDEYSFILQGTVGAHLGGEDFIGHEGDLIRKPKGQWHTFWNAGETPARILEIISPAGLEVLFRALDSNPDLYEPDKLIPLAAEYGSEVDFDGTMPIVERHTLKF